MRSNWPKADAGALVLRVVPIGIDSTEPDQGREVPLPQDLPPGGELKMVLATDRFPSSWARVPLKVEPAFASVGQVEVPPGIADLRIAVNPVFPEVAAARATVESRVR
jgi:hypothetical protein